MIAVETGYSIAHLVRCFQKYLEEPVPQLSPLDQSECAVAYLLIDGLWFGRYFVLMVYRQSKTLIILHVSVAGKEGSAKIAKDLKVLLEIGYRFTGIVSDGGTGIVGAVTEVFPHSSHQICLAHMHRRLIAALGRYPKDYRVKNLKRLADHVWLIESREALKWWKEQVVKWIKDNHTFLCERRYDTEGHWWYIRKGVRAAVNLMVKLPKISFMFLHGHPLMPKTTNELEAQFGHVAKRWLAHRGLKRSRWQNYLNWFVYLYNLDKLTPSKPKSI
jgi:hypothetical protein